MDPSEYRKQYEKELASAAEQAPTGYRAVLKSATPAAEGVGEGLSEEYSIKDLSEIAADSRRDVSVRIAAVEAIGEGVIEKEETIQGLLEMLRNRGEPVELRRAVFTLLKQLEFQSKLFAAQRAEFVSVLRELCDDPDEEIRTQALEALAQKKDYFAQQRLLEGLRDPAKALVPEERALQFLGYDIHADYYPLIREIAQKTENTRSKQEAIRLLSSDPEAAPLLAEIFRDKGEDAEVRNECAAALRGVAPLEFERLARDAALDDDDVDEVRAASITGLPYFGNRAAVAQDSELNERLESIPGKGKSKPLERAVERYKARRGR
jgi:HEAT repeat protein